MATDGGATADDVLSRSLPDALSRELGGVYGTGAVETYGDWLTTMADAVGREPTTDDMCCVDDARHTVEVDGGTEEYICVVDPLMVPFLRDEPAVVRSEVPGSDAVVTARVDEDGDLTVEPETAVVSFGAASAAGEGIEDPVERGYAALCEYTHAFPDEESYESWAARVERAPAEARTPTEGSRGAETAAAVTTAMSYEDATAMAAALAERFGD